MFNKYTCERCKGTGEEPEATPDDYTCGKGSDCDCVTGQHENIVEFKPVYENKSRRWLALAVMALALAFWAWVLI